MADDMKNVLRNSEHWPSMEQSRAAIWEAGSFNCFASSYPHLTKLLYSDHVDQQQQCRTVLFAVVVLLVVAAAVGANVAVVIVVVVAHIPAVGDRCSLYIVLLLLLLLLPSLSQC